jgi:hypothetical protein
VTQLRRMMLEELERRNYAQSTTRAYLHTIEDLARYSNDRRTSLGPSTFVNTRPTCSGSGSCRRTPSISGPAHCDSFSSSSSRNHGASLKRPTQEETSGYPKFSARSK